jgi:cysteine synthase A
VVELTSGNTGIGLAIVCAVRGYRMVAVMSKGNTLERRRMLEAVGAEVILVPQVGRPRQGQVSGADLQKVEEKTRVDAFCALVGTGGTFTGVARALKARNPAVRCYAVEPASAPVLAGKRVRNPRHKLQGGGYASVPPLWEPALLRWVPHGHGRRGHPGGPAARAGGRDLRRLLLRG